MAEYIEKRELLNDTRIRKDDDGVVKTHKLLCRNYIKSLHTANVVEREKIKLLGEELRKFREGITDERVLTGFNMAIAICNKYLGESEDKE